MPDWYPIIHQFVSRREIFQMSFPTLTSPEAGRSEVKKRSSVISHAISQRASSVCLSVCVLLIVLLIGNQPLKIWRVFGFHGDWTAAYWQTVDEGSTGQDCERLKTESRLTHISVACLFIHSVYFITLNIILADITATHTKLSYQLIHTEFAGMYWGYSTKKMICHPLIRLT